MNKWIGIGRFVKDPEERTNGDSIVTRFTLAVDRKFKKDETADFISCVSFGKTAEFISKYFQKGNRIAVTGRIQTGSYTNKDNQKVYTTDVVVEEAEFCESKSESKVESKPETKEDDGFMNVEDTDDMELPFA